MNKNELVDIDSLIELHKLTDAKKNIDEQLSRINKDGVVYILEADDDKYENAVRAINTSVLQQVITSKSLKISEDFSKLIENMNDSLKQTAWLAKKVEGRWLFKRK